MNNTGSTSSRPASPDTASELAAMLLGGHLPVITAIVVNSASTNVGAWISVSADGIGVTDIYIHLPIVKDGEFVTGFEVEAVTRLMADAPEIRPRVL